MCHTHWRQYTNALRKGAVARQAEGPTEPVESPAAREPGAAPEAPAHEHTLAASLVGEGEPIETPAPRQRPRSKGQVETAPEAENAAAG